MDPTLRATPHMSVGNSHPCSSDPNAQHAARPVRQAAQNHETSESLHLQCVLVSSFLSLSPSCLSLSPLFCCPFRPCIYVEMTPCNIRAPKPNRDGQWPTNFHEIPTSCNAKARLSALLFPWSFFFGLIIGRRSRPQFNIRESAPPPSAAWWAFD